MLKCKSFLINFSVVICVTLAHQEVSKLLIISFDGFRWDYLHLTKLQNKLTPNFDKLRENGVSLSGDNLKNVFVTKTFPNHYAVATGLYEEDHGMVGNEFFDPLFNLTFDVWKNDSKELKWWDGKSSTKGKLVEPIWLTNQKCQLKCHRFSGSALWPGSDVEGLQPKYYRKYNKSLTFYDRMKLITDWFTSDDDPINLGMLYYEEPDSTGHIFGPNSIEIIEKIVELDKLLGEFFDLLISKDLFDELNIVVVSDHGMAKIDNIIYLNDYVQPGTYKIYGTSPVFNLLPANKALKDELYANLSKAENLIVYYKENIPEELHYINNRRILDIVITAKEGFRICKQHNDTCLPFGGDHGYISTLKSMHPIFIASGPAFRKNFIFNKVFEVVDLYPLFCKLLGVRPNFNDGVLDRVYEMLKESEKLSNYSKIAIYTVLGFCIVIVLICIVCLLRGHIKYFVQTTKELQMSVGMVSKDGQKPLLNSDEEDIA